MRKVAEGKGIVPEDLVLRLGVALAIGFLMGVERGWRERDAEAGSRIAGIRTYGLIGLLGGVMAALSQLFGGALLFGVAFLGVAAAYGWFKIEEARQESNLSITGLVAALLVYGLGGLAVMGDLLPAAAAAVAATGLLSSRDLLHGWLRRLTWRELRSALLLLAMTVVVLPILPDRAIDPFGGFNPRQIWLFTILTASISFAGYVATRIAGPSASLAITGIAGGVVSSTIVTVTMARRSRTEAGGDALVAGALLASMVSVLRVAVLAGVVRPSLLLLLGGPALAAALVFGLWGAWHLRRAKGLQATEAELQNPFDIRMVLLIGLFLAVIAFLFGWISAQFSPATIYGVAAFTGLIDIDALTLSTARLVPSSLGERTAAAAILLGVFVNGAERVVYAAGLGTMRFTAHFLGATAVAAAAGGLAFWLSLSAGI